MTSKERVLQREYDRGRADARQLQEQAPGMTGTELNAAGDRIPRFKEAVKHMNMLNRAADRVNGFVCKSSAGRVVRLIQNYDSNIFTGEPEELPAQFAFVWSDDPAKALPFVAISTSPYMKNNCCMEGTAVYRSVMDNNVFAPSAYPSGWERVEV